ncbi:hypothetical protein DL546_003659 [Coniochaeta pulveracea]|uniref:Uncharacterized protein n=1 Tax=Coniochaeta pulveracea TaxID=177199 RepID=A0A420Y3R0_9PEZI|nr:hypothetical protein DL546_003659 [Coniochaeta pulveracea]
MFRSEALFILLEGVVMVGAVTLLSIGHMFLIMDDELERPMVADDEIELQERGRRREVKHIDPRCPET